ncbi:hypothetical protein J4G08_03670 [Candidatus Poribacteria bacterium]|nr:hypothetical protein [Candidatus Poribacteria bacterium]
MGIGFINWHRVVMRSGAYLLLLSILLIAFWIRIQGRDNIPEGQFTGKDAYLYYWMTNIISEQGGLPTLDMHRWMPFGRDLEGILPFYSYVSAYVHKGISLFFPEVSLYSVALFVPVLCFVFGLGVLCVFLYCTSDIISACIVGIILATLPITILRSTIGFSDRDSWCFLLGVLTVTTYLWKYQTQSTKHRYFLSVVSGGFAFLGGLSWEGFGVFICVILSVEIWQFLISEQEERLGEYLIWVLMFVPTLYLFSPTYRHGSGFTTHLELFVLIPPIVLLALRCLRYFLITVSPFSKRFHLHARTVAFLLIVGTFVIGFYYLLSQSSDFSQKTVPFHPGRLMQTVSELKDATYLYWILHFGGVFLLGSIGLLVITIHKWEKIGIVLLFPLALFILTTFFREYLTKLLGQSFCDTLFLAALCITPIVILIAGWLRKEPGANEHCYIAVIVWFLIWTGLARGAERYSFFAAFPMTFFIAALVKLISESVIEKCTTWIRSRWHTSEKSYIVPGILKTGIAVIVVLGLLFWMPMGRHGDRTIQAATQTRKPFPGQGDAKNALDWMKATLGKQENAVVAASWEYGSLLNVLGGVKTIIDQDHYIPYWIHLYCRHVFAAQSEHEALAFLKTHLGTHLMLIEKDMMENTGTYSYVGSNENLDRLGNIVEMTMQNSVGAKYTMVSSLPNTRLTQIEINFNEKKIVDTLTVKAQFKSGEVVQMPYISYLAKKRFENIKKDISERFGNILLYFDAQGKLNRAYYITSIGWKSLAVKLFFGGLESPHFVPAYPQKDFPAAKVKMWEIRYPTDIKKNSKYLETEPPEGY